MSGLIVSTDRLVSSSEARNQFGKLVDEVSKNSGNYFVILDNGKVAALLVNPDWLKDKKEESTFPDLEKLRTTWGRHTGDIQNALENLDSIEKKDLPKLLM